MYCRQVRTTNIGLKGGRGQLKTDPFHCFPQVRVGEQAGDGVYGLAEGRERVNGEWAGGGLEKVGLKLGEKVWLERAVLGGAKGNL